jgi:hypothetical protein
MYLCAAGKLMRLTICYIDVMNVVHNIKKETRLFVVL